MADLNIRRDWASRSERVSWRLVDPLLQSRIAYAAQGLQNSDWSRGCFREDAVVATSSLVACPGSYPALESLRFAFSRIRGARRVQPVGSALVSSLCDT